MEAVLTALEAGPAAADWPDPESDLEDRIFSAATLVFVEAARSGRARRALRHVLGGRRSEHLLGLLALIRTAHYWTVLHSDLAFEEDIHDLLRASEELARLLLEDPEAARCDLGARFFSELEDLRGLNERREFEQARRTLEAQAADALRSAASPVMAIAAVHERLYTGSDIRVVSLEVFLGNLCDEIGRAQGCADGIEISIAPVDVPTDMAIPLAIIVNELTNVIKHAGPPCRIGMTAGAQALTLTVSDTGQGPSQSKHTTGMGSRLVQALVRQLGARIETRQLAESYTVAIIIPLPHGNDGLEPRAVPAHQEPLLP